MASNLPTMPFVVLLLLFPSLAFADSVSPGSLCQSAPDPSFCNSMLPPRNGTVYDHCRFSVIQSLSQARKFCNLVDKYLQRRSSLSAATVAALEDCWMLADLNLDFLSTSFQTMNETTRLLTNLEVDNVQTLLSAILTNQQTCLDGFLDTASLGSLKNGLSLPLSNDTKLYSVSLALFTKAWVPRYQKKPKLSWQQSTKTQLGFQNGRLLLVMSSRTRAIYEAVSRRKLSQTNITAGNKVLVKDIVTVSQDGTGNFTTINDAVSAAPNKSSSSDSYFLIYVTAGVYEEYVSINKKKINLMMIGDGINKTIITGNRSVADGWTTFKSATFDVTASGFVGVNITFRNTAGPEKHQAVAVRNGADLSTFYSCSFEGYQDTLYAHSQRQFYRECEIYGTVDFIFGNSAVVFQNCKIFPRRPMSGQFNTITAQGRTDPNQNTGISIQNCTIRAAEDLAAKTGVAATYLGRPWKEYSRTVYMQSFIDGVIDGDGWHAWDGNFALSSLYYAEFNNSGPGSSTSHRVTWQGYHVINASVAANFTVSNFLFGDEWLPHTGVTYTSDLIM